MLQNALVFILMALGAIWFSFSLFLLLTFARILFRLRRVIQQYGAPHDAQLRSATEISRTVS